MSSDTEKTVRLTRGSARSAKGAAQFAPGTLIGDRYRIASLLGSGGMGEVYRADDHRGDLHRDGVARRPPRRRRAAARGRHHLHAAAGGRAGLVDVPLGFIPIAVLAALAIWAFRTSLGGRPAFNLD